MLTHDSLVTVLTTQDGLPRSFNTKREMTYAEAKKLQLLVTHPAYKGTNVIIMGEK